MGDCGRQAGQGHEGGREAGAVQKTEQTQKFSPDVAGRQAHLERLQAMLHQQTMRARELEREMQHLRAAQEQVLAQERQALAALDAARANLEQIKAEKQAVEDKSRRMADESNRVRADTEKLTYETQILQAELQMAQRQVGLEGVKSTPAMTADQKLDAILDRLERMEKRLSDLERIREKKPE